MSIITFVDEINEISKDCFLCFTFFISSFILDYVKLISIFLVRIKLVHTVTYRIFYGESRMFLVTPNLFLNKHRNDW